MTSKFHLERFEKTSPERRATVLAEATQQFATNGFAATSINDIASAAGISIGAMYTYFSSKENLFLALIDHASARMAAILQNVAKQSTDIFDYVERMLEAARTFAKEDPHLNRLYLLVTTQATPAVSTQLEGLTPAVMGDFLRQGQEAGIVSNSLDIPITTLCIDNLFMMYQFSFASDYYQERLRVYLGEMKDTTVEVGIARFIEAALRPR